MTFATALANTPAFSKHDFPSWPIWDEYERDALLSALESGYWAGSQATLMSSFCKDFAQFQNAKHGIPLFNGTVTLEAALIACGIGEGDEVIVPAISFVSTASAVLRVNATPIIVDVDEDSLCINPTKVEEAITPQTRAVISVHISGVMCDLDRLVDICNKKGLILIEDCAHAHGSAWKGQGAGSYGHFGSFSFQHSKLISSGEGGILLGNDQELIDKAWDYANCGRKKGNGVYFHATVGSNYRMTEWQGAILSAQLKRYPSQLSTRESAAAFLDKSLSTITGIKPQARDKRMTRQGHYCYVFHVDPDVFGADGRDRFFTQLSEAGVPLSLSYPPINDLEVFRKKHFLPTIKRDLDVLRFKTPCAQKASANTIWIHHRTLLADNNTLCRLIELIENIARSLKSRGR